VAVADEDQSRPTSARTMLWQKASARTVATARPSAVPVPVQVEQGADGGGTLALLAVRGEVVLTEQQLGGGVQSRPRPPPVVPQDVSAQQRVDTAGVVATRYA